MNRWLALLLAVAAACGERRDPEPDNVAPAAPGRRFEDTEARTFEAVCDPRSICQVRAIDAAHWPAPDGVSDAQPTFELGVWGRYHILCDTWRGGGELNVLDRNACRAVACRTDADCLPAYGLPGVRCDGGMCGDPSRPIGPMDVAALCHAGTGAPRNTETQRQRSSLIGNCTPPCPVPPACRQPAQGQAPADRR